ncbi:RHS repeat domain-containing protein [Nonomuraea polychroma]|uniref:RHS repeat domain-containing protein n=1 Tax=Nonomuraea polychroma TaxID=46176 RepID=UPI003D91AD83
MRRQPSKILKAENDLSEPQRFEGIVKGNLHRASDQSKIQNADNPGTYLDHTYTYTYDPRDRVSRAMKSPASGGPVEIETYSHDANSNVWEQDLSGEKTTFTYDRNRLMTSVTDGATSTYTYDPYGRLRTVQGGGKTWERYTYDGFDHVTRHEKLGGDGITNTVTTYTYDPLDRTTSKTEKEGTTAAKTTTYSYLGLSEEVLDEEVAGRLTKSFQYSPWGERLSQVKIKADSTEESSYYGYNSHTDVEQITSESGDTRATYGYTAYGKNDDKLFTGVDKPDPIDPTAKEEYNPYRFNAKRWDNSTGMYDMGFRNYNPGLNRFLNLDAYNGALADLSLSMDPWTANRYAFAGGNPITGIEIDGHIPDGFTSGEWNAYQHGYGGHKKGYNAYKAYRYAKGMMSWQEEFQWSWRQAGKNPNWVVRDEDTMLGAAAVYDKNGKLIAFETGFFSGHYNAKIDKGSSHLERRIVAYLEKKGLLEKGNTLQIITSGTLPPCGKDTKKGCDTFLREYSQSNGIHVKWTSRGASQPSYGTPNMGGGGLAVDDVFEADGAWKGTIPSPKITGTGKPAGALPRFGRIGGRMLGAFGFAGDILSATQHGLYIYRHGFDAWLGMMYCSTMPANACASREQLLA